MYEALKKFSSNLFTETYLFLLLFIRIFGDILFFLLSIYEEIIKIIIFSRIYRYIEKYLINKINNLKLCIEIFIVLS